MIVKKNDGFACRAGCPSMYKEITLAKVVFEKLHVVLSFLEGGWKYSGPGASGFCMFSQYLWFLHVLAIFVVRLQLHRQLHMVTRWPAVLAWPFHVDVGLKSRSKNRRSKNRQGQAGYYHSQNLKSLSSHIHVSVRISLRTRFFSPWKFWSKFMTALDPAFGSSSAPELRLGPGTSLPSGEAASRGKTWVMVGWLGDRRSSSFLFLHLLLGLSASS